MALIHPEFQSQTTKFPNLAYMAQNSKCGSQPDLICVVSSTFQSSCKYIDVTYTLIPQPLNLIDVAEGAERHSEVRKSQDLLYTRVKVRSHASHTLLSSALLGIGHRSQARLRNLCRQVTLPKLSKTTHI